QYNCDMVGNINDIFLGGFYVDKSYTWQGISQLQYYNWTLGLFTQGGAIIQGDTIGTSAPFIPVGNLLWIDFVLSDFDFSYYQAGSSVSWRHTWSEMIGTTFSLGYSKVYLDLTGDYREREGFSNPFPVTLNQSEDENDQLLHYTYHLLDFQMNWDIQLNDALGFQFLAAQKIPISAEESDSPSSINNSDNHNDVFGGTRLAMSIHWK
nr:hypothetical protein [Spirochaetaceae bacterium]